MAASILDKFKKGYGFFSTTLSAQKNSGASSMSLSDATGLPTTTGLVFTVGRVNSSGTSTPSTRAIYKGTLSGTTVSNLTLTEGTDQTHAAGTVVEITFTATHWNDAVDGIVAEHNQDGTHAAITATSLTTSGDIETTAGALKSDTISEHTSAAGVTIDGMQIKDNLVVGASGKGVDNTSLNTAAGELGAAWQSWTPTLSGLFDDAKWTKTCKYIQIGKTVHYRLMLVASTTTPMSGAGNPLFTLPVTAVDYAPAAGSIFVIGTGGSTDANGGTFLTTASFNSTTTAKLRVHGAGSSYVGSDVASSTIPFTWTTSDEITISGTYEAA